MLCEEWLKLRDVIMFKTPRGEFENKLDSIRQKFEKEFIEVSDKRKNELVYIIGELTVDIQSYLKKWHLQLKSAREKVSDKEIEKQSELNYKLLEKWGAVDRVDYIKKEVGLINKSNMVKLSLLADEERINNRWGNDYASGLAEEMRKGAVLATTNPSLINNERKENPYIWDKAKADLKSKHPGADSTRLASIMTMQVVLKNCRELRPVYDITKGKYGYISLQISPKNSTDAVKMSEEAEFIYSRLKEELKGTPNVVFKLPGTKVAVKAAKSLTQKGIGVTITLSFSVDQHLVFAKAIESGNAPVSFVVMMSGRLDDPVRDELAELGVEGAAEAARYASEAVIRKSYYELYEKRKFKKSAILVASLRGPWNIEASVTKGSAPIYITSFPDKTQEYDSLDREIDSHIDEEMPGDVMNKLMKSRIFRQAYGTDKMMPEDFDSFYPVVVTLNSFSESYDEFVKYLEV